MRVLDIDLDFFVHGIAHHRPRDSGRLPEDEYKTWALDEIISFLETRCGLTGPLPGIAVEYHAEVFDWWRNMIAGGQLHQPFSVTHLDAHADLGLGDASHKYIMTDLLFREPTERAEPEQRLEDGNFLAFAIACRWVSDLTYGRNEPFGPPVDWIPSKHFGQNDLPRHYMKGCDLDSGAIQLRAVPPNEFERGLRNDQVGRPEPDVPFRYVPAAEYQSDEPFDVVCLAKSPNYTPESSDAAYAEIQARYIDEQAWA